MTEIQIVRLSLSCLLGSLVHIAVRGLNEREYGREIYLVDILLLFVISMGTGSLAGLVGYVFRQSELTHLLIYTSTGSILGRGGIKFFTSWITGTLLPGVLNGMLNYVQKSIINKNDKDA